MLHATTPPGQKRAAFRAGLASGKLLRFPGAFSPLSAMLIARHGFEGVYVSGAVIAADLGLPDIGLTTLAEVAGRAPAGWASATAISSLIIVPPVRVMSTRPPNDRLAGSGSW